MYPLGKRVFALLTASAVAASVAMPANAVDYFATIYASGLDNPRGLAFDSTGALYIAEGGTFAPPGGPSTNTPEGPATFGQTGAITRVFGGVQSRIWSDLPSLTSPAGAATGPQDVAFYNGLGYFVVGLGANPAVRYTDLGSAGAAANLASLYSFGSGGITKVADLGTYEQTVNPASDQIDSNPYHLTAGPNGLLVTDAGGNSLLNVTASGAISPLGTFPEDGGIDAVPTGISVGPDGAFYVGQLTGFPFVPEAANIFRIDALTGDKTVFATGFTNITDIAWGLDGALYVLQFADTGILGGGAGSIQRLNSDGTHTTIYSGLAAPTGLEIGKDGAFYVTILSPVPGIGQVLRIGAVPEPATWAMMIMGFALIGSGMRRRQVSVRFA